MGPTAKWTSCADQAPATRAEFALERNKVTPVGWIRTAILGFTAISQIVEESASLRK
jgi:uncharacterized membrane protein YidH (DUF202 family)